MKIGEDAYDTDKDNLKPIKGIQSKGDRLIEGGKLRVDMMYTAMYSQGNDINYSQRVLASI